MESGYNVELAKVSEPGKRIPEFVVSLNSSKLSVEAKKVNNDSILDNIFGDSFIDGIDHRRSQSERKRQRISLLELVPVVCSKVTVPQSSQQYLLTLCV